MALVNCIRVLFNMALPREFFLYRCPLNVAISLWHLWFPQTMAWLLDQFSKCLGMSRGYTLFIIIFFQCVMVHGAWCFCCFCQPTFFYFIWYLLPVSVFIFDLASQLLLFLVIINAEWSVSVQLNPCVLPLSVGAGLLVACCTHVTSSPGLYSTCLWTDTTASTSECQCFYTYTTITNLIFQNFHVFGFVSLSLNLGRGV